MRTLSDITYKQDVLKMPCTATVQEACTKMRERRVGAILVTDARGTLTGIFTARDAIARVIADCRSAKKTTLSEVMTPNPVTMPPKTTAIEALRMMWDGGFRHIPVLDRGKIAGIVSRGDFKGTECQWLEDERIIWERLR